MSSTVMIIALMAFIVTVCIGIYIYCSEPSDFPKITDSKKDGTFTHKPLSGDLFESYFPMKTKEGYMFVGTTGLSFIDPTTSTTSSSSTLKTAYIDYADNTKYTFSLGENNKMVVNQLRNRQAFYGKILNKQKPIYVYSMFLAEMSPQDYLKYVNFISATAQDMSSDNVYSPSKSEYKNHPYYIHIRKDMSPEALKGKESIGTTVVCFPETNIAVTLYFYNTKDSDGDANMITKQDMESVAKQLIDYVAEHTKKAN